MAIQQNSYQRESAVDQRYKYNGIERQSDLDLNVDMATFRTLDPALGRWWQVDPEVDQFYSLTPYNSNFNNPIRYDDPDGDCPTCPFFNAGVVTGAFNTIKSTITGTLDFLSQGSTVGGRIDLAVGTATTAKAIADNPGAVVDAVVEGAKNTANTLIDGNAFEQGQIVGAASVAIAEVALGTKGLGAASKVAKAVNKFGDLTKSEIRKIQNVVDEAGRPLEVVGSAAKGSRRNPGSKLPIGKGKGTKSDIDFLVPPSSLDNFTDLVNKLPEIDPNTGIIPGVHNPKLGPGIRFEPGGKKPIKLKEDK